ncbi:hypothetical protein [Saccharopolyspora gloriosae]|uniref:hypothetical protein n=1 Tax=Saccharopolyspora gloriosae TaxID=455344 RepID=UPI001FB61032|nr:hypothetical protein [Saccharopolyspora gloriosae]
MPGEDGKAVIQEGDRTITLERAPDGSITVDVNNGAGQPPIQETVEFGADDQPAPDARPGAPGAVPGGQPAWPGAEPPGQDAAGAPVGRDPGASFDPTAPVGTPPQVGGFEAPASGGTEPVVPAASAMSAGPEVEAPDGPAPTASQSAGLASAFTSEGVSGSFASMSGQLFAGDLAEPPAQHPTPFGGPPPQAGATELAAADDAAPGSSQGATGMGAMSDPAAAQGGGQQQAGGGAMGGGMMGGMGGGQQGGGAGDQERTNSSPWRTQGQLFDDVADESGARHRAVLGEDRQG